MRYSVAIVVLVLGCNQGGHTLSVDQDLQRDLEPAQDQAQDLSPPDLSTSPDMGAAPDLNTVLDLSGPTADLDRPDLSTAPDLATVPDLLSCGQYGQPCCAGNQCSPSQGVYCMAGSQADPPGSGNLALRCIFANNCGSYASPACGYAGESWCLSNPLGGWYSGNPCH